MACTILIAMLTMPTLLALFALKQATEAQPAPVRVRARAPRIEARRARRGQWLH